MNHQVPMAIEKSLPEDGKILIKEIFYSIQGEGPHSGRPAIFIRLGGCNLQCGGAGWTCVVGATSIATVNGKNPIKDVKVGDLVYGFDGKQIVAKPVLETMVNYIDSVLKVSFDHGVSLFITGEHPGWLINRGWVEAKDWKVGDVLFHTTSSDWMTLANPMKNADVVERSKKAHKVSDRVKTVRQTVKTVRQTSVKLIPKNFSYWERPNSRLNQSQRMKDNNPMKSLEVRKKSWTNRKHTLTNIESFVLEVVEELNLPIEFVGDGSFWVEGHCPDFRVVGTNKVIEVWDSTQSEYLKRDAAYIESRKQYYESFGYSCQFLVFNPFEFREKGDAKGTGLRNCRIWLAEKLNEYVHNGKTVTKIELINRHTNPKAYIRLAGTLSNDIPVYNLEVAECNSYFANTVLLHNCDTDYSGGDRLSIQAIVDQAIEFCGGLKINYPLVVITGGEPFRQYLLPTLCEMLVRDQFQVQIETNGTCFQKSFSKLEDFVSVVCSPKSEHLHKELEPHISCLKLLVKNVRGKPYVCFHNTDQPLIMALNRWNHFPIYLQPLEDENVQKNTEIVVESCLQFNLPISLQLHKILNLR